MDNLQLLQVLRNMIGAGLRVIKTNPDQKVTCYFSEYCVAVVPLNGLINSHTEEHNEYLSTLEHCAFVHVISNV